MAEFSLDLAEGSRELLRLSGDKDPTPRRPGEPLEGADDPDRGESGGSFVLPQKLLVQGNLVTDGEDGDVYPAGNFHGLVNGRLAVVLDPVGDEQDRPLLVLPQVGKSRGYGAGVVERGLAVGFGMVQLGEEAALVC